MALLRRAARSLIWINAGLTSYAIGTLMKATMLVVLLTISTAQVAEPTGTLTLACDGTRTQSDAKPEAISTSVVINFAGRTIEGTSADDLRLFGGVQIGIWKYDDMTIRFGTAFAHWDVFGSIDRVTGNMEATRRQYDQKTHEVRYSTGYSLR
jgi:hypothetical protein